MKIITTTIILLASSCLASCASTAKIERKYYSSWEPDIGYSQVVQAGDTLFISGLTSEKESFEDQLHDIYQGITGILADYQLDSESIVKETIYTTDIESLKANIEQRKKYYKNAKFPSATWVEVQHLYSPNHKLEVEITAVKN